MRTNPANYYELMTFGLGNRKFQSFVDKFQLKYNNLQADGFKWDPEIQIDYTYEQLLASLNIATLPTYVDEASEGLDKSFGEFKIGSNKIPTQKHYYPFNTKMLREKMLMVQQFGASALNGETQNALLDMMFTSIDGLLAGNRNALTHQRMQIVSKGQFTISLENNPRGLKGITFDFNIPAKNKATLTTSKRWWTSAEHIKTNEGADSDPLMDLKNWHKAAKKLGYPAHHFEMATELYDDLLTHSKVLERIGFAQYPAASSAEIAQTYAANQTDEALKSVIERIVGCAIVAYDTKAAVDKFDTSAKKLVPETIDNFDLKNVALVPNGEIGTIKSVRPLILADDPTVRTAWFDGGRTLITNRYESKTRSMYVESEMAVLCVPTMPQYMCVYTVTA